MSLRLTVVSLCALLSSAGCAVRLGGSVGFDPLGGQAQAEQQQANDQAAQRYQERQREKQELEEKAKTTTTVQLTELGLELTAAGDVKAAPGSEGDVTGIELAGPASDTYLVVSDAKEDRYDLNARINELMATKKGGIDVIQSGTTPEGGWELEYAFRVYFNDGSTRAVKSYFTRRLVGGKPVNCLMQGFNLGDTTTRLNRTISACKSLRTLTTAAR